MGARGKKCRHRKKGKRKGEAKEKRQMKHRMTQSWILLLLSRELCGRWSRNGNKVGHKVKRPGSQGKRKKKKRSQKLQSVV